MPSDVSVLSLYVFYSFYGMCFSFKSSFILAVGVVMTRG